MWRDLSVAIVSDESLLGREVQQAFTERAPDLRVHATDENSEAAILKGRDGEPVLMPSVPEESSLASAPVVILAGTTEAARQIRLSLEGSPGGPAIIDLTEPPDAEASFTVRAPLVEPPGLDAATATVYRIAHPAAVVLAEFLHRLRKGPGLERSVVNIFEPVSQYGKGAIDELQLQTTNLFNFRKLPKDLFDAQLTFNMLAAFGKESPFDLAATERRIADDLELLLGRTGQPSIRLVQAPVFHGLSISAWVELPREAGVAELIKAVAGDRVEVRSAKEEPPTNVGFAGQSGMSIGRIEPDRRNKRAFWFWIVADNHRVTAENTVALARLLAPVEGHA